MRMRGLEPPRDFTPTPAISATPSARTPMFRRPSRTSRAVLERRRLHSHTPTVAAHQKSRPSDAIRDAKMGVLGSAATFH